MIWVGFDVGGTFVDIVAFDVRTGKVHVLKQRSSRRQAASSVRDGLRTLLAETGFSGTEIARLAHGTTLVTNLLVERKGSRIGVITNSGFRDVMEIGRMRRPHLYDLSQRKPEPLVDRLDIAEVGGRIDARGNEIEPLDMDGIAAMIERLKADGVEALAVCFLHSYADPAHEEAAGRIAEAADLPVSLSARVSAEYGEYERFTTAVMNSYVMPVTKQYLSGTVHNIASLGIRAPLEVLQSNGGVIPVETAARFPVRLASSGPAGGVTAAAVLSGRIGRRNLITLDMGGTSTDVSLVVDGEPATISEHELEGLPLRAVSVDIRSIGAGGGSLARLDRTGALRVGPESAGAEPGPACYGWGGTEPTVADADLVLGYLDPERFCDGRVRLDVERARHALKSAVADPRGVSIDEAALGVLGVCITNMVGAVRNITMERGHDPRDFSLVAFGGAGPVHASLVAAELGIPEVVILRDPGLLSAKGMLLTNYRVDTFRTAAGRLNDVDMDELNGMFDALAVEATAQLPPRDGEPEVRRILALCYEGQQNVVPVELADFPVTKAHLPGIAEGLDRKFKAIFGFLPRNRTPQILHLRVIAERRLDTERLTQGSLPPCGEAPPLPRARRPVLYPTSGGIRVDTPIYERGLLPAGTEISGPAIIEESYSNTLVCPGQTARIDANGNILIAVE